MHEFEVEEGGGFISAPLRGLKINFLRALKTPSFSVGTKKVNKGMPKGQRTIVMIKNSKIKKSQKARLE